MRFDIEKIAKVLEDTKLGDEVYDKLKEHYPDDVLEWVKDADWELKSVPLSEINMSRRPGGRNMDKVKGIAKAVEAGEKMDPVVLVKQSDGSYQVADGYHRTLGFQHAGKDVIKAYVADCGCDDGPWDKEMHDKKLNVEPGKKANEMSEGLAKLANLSLKNFLPSLTGERLRSLEQAEQALLDERGRHIDNGVPLGVAYDLLNGMSIHKPELMNDHLPLSAAYNDVLRAEAKNKGTADFLKGQIARNLGDQQAAARDQQLSRIIAGSAAGLGLTGAGVGAAIHHHNQQKEANEMEHGLAKLAAGEEATVTDDREQMGLLPRLGLILGSTGVGAGLGHLADRRLGTNPIAALGGGALGLGASAIATAPSYTPEDVAVAGRLVLQAMLAGQAINQSQQQQALQAQQAQQAQQDKDLAARKANTPPPTTSAGSGTFKTRQSMDKAAAELVAELSKWANFSIGELLSPEQVEAMHQAAAPAPAPVVEPVVEEAAHGIHPGKLGLGLGLAGLGAVGTGALIHHFGQGSDSDGGAR